METTTSLLLFLEASAMLKNTTSQGTVTYRILPFEASTRLYYEYQGVMRRRVSTWRITSFLDTQKLCLGLEGYKSQINALTPMCRTILGAESQQLIESFHLENKWEATYKLHRGITHEAEELNGQTDSQLPAHLHQRLRRRTTTPMLGFLGRIIGPVASLLTYEYGLQIEDEINNLNQVAANLSHLVGKQTHVVRAQFEEIQGRFNQAQDHKCLWLPTSRTSTWIYLSYHRSALEQVTFHTNSSFKEKAWRHLGWRKQVWRYWRDVKQTWRPPQRNQFSITKQNQTVHPDPRLFCRDRTPLNRINNLLWFHQTDDCSDKLEAIPATKG